jgi:hypothetical protein
MIYTSNQDTRALQWIQWITASNSSCLSQQQYTPGQACMKHKQHWLSTSESQREAHTCSQASNDQLIIKASLALATDHYSQA